MFDHVTIRTCDRAASGRFYTTVLAALAVEPTHDCRELIEFGDFSIIEASAPHAATRHLHVAFRASSRAAVDAFWVAGTSAGYQDDGAPGIRPQYLSDYYGAFLRGPDGNSVEAVHHSSMLSGGNIDHLWIGVRDLAASVSFYALIAPHAGLRPGARWPGAQQFRGAGATFVLIDDGRPATENLHLAFPAADGETVRNFYRAGIEAGHRDNGAPGAQPQYRPGYHSAYLLDPDGTNVESVFHERR